MRIVENVEQKTKKKRVFIILVNRVVLYKYKIKFLYMNKIHEVINSIEKKNMQSRIAL